MVLKDLTDKINVSSYLFDYVRSDNLVIGGYTDSVLKLQGPEALGSIKYFRKIIPEGAINKIRVPGSPRRQAHLPRAGELPIQHPVRRRADEVKEAPMQTLSNSYRTRWRHECDKQV